MTSLLAVIASADVRFINWLDELLVRRKTNGSRWQSRWLAFNDEPYGNKNPEIAKPSRDCYDGERMTESDAGEARQSPVRLRYKIIAYVATWIAALLLTAPGMWPLAYMFPLGLVAVIDRHLANDGGRGVLIGCYVVYIVHAFFFFRSKTTLRTAILYGVLVILLIGNVAGCREMIHSH